MKDYKATITLKNNEIPAKVNKETGEFTELPQQARHNNIPEGKIIFEPDALFRKDYTVSWKYLDDNLTALEFNAAYTLALMAKANTNSLEPLCDETTFVELAKLLNVGKNKITTILKTLFDYGVYGRFEVADQRKQFGKFWIFNPYLSFSGKLIHSDIAELFKGTLIAINFNKYKNN